MIDCIDLIGHPPLSILSAPQGLNSAARCLDSQQILERPEFRHEVLGDTVGQT